MTALVAFPQLQQLQVYDRAEEQETAVAEGETVVTAEEESAQQQTDESVDAAATLPLSDSNTTESAEAQMDAKIDELLAAEESEDDDDDQIPELEEATNDEVPDGQNANTAFSNAFPSSLDLETSQGAAEQPSEPFGGLSNLGNTCYMASALQMLASLDRFIDCLREEQPSGAAEEETKLRTTFLDLMRRLRAGETVSPNEFKQAVDERSPLFLGFRQQDSHEFLTTLLDLIDEEYKAKKNDEDKNETMKEENAVVDEETKEESELLVDASVSSLESATKKARTEEPMETEPSVSSSQMMNRAVQFVKSFSQLDNAAIERLLHDTTPIQDENALILPDVSTTSIGPHQCKLIGGRMAPASDVVLTRYDDDEESSQRQQQHVAMEATATTVAPALDNDDGASVDSSCTCVESPVDTTFTTSVRVRLTCDSCKYTRTHTEKFQHLSLDVGGTSIEDGMRRFFAPERRELKCEKCFCETAWQTMEITKLPPALLFHFKRFIVDVSPDYSSVTYRKNQSAVLFDDELTLDQDVGMLTEFLADDYDFTHRSREDNDDSMLEVPQKYSLRSVVNHVGSSASCGHYYADCKRLDDQEGAEGEQEEEQQHQWTRFNDSFVSRITASQAVEQSQQTAYMVLYELE